MRFLKELQCCNGFEQIHVESSPVPELGGAVLEAYHDVRQVRFCR